MSQAWGAGWAQAVTDITGAGISVTGRTIRIRVTPGLAGDAVRIVLSSRFSAAPVVIGRAAVISGGTVVPLRFDGATGVTLAPGADVRSDAASITVAAGTPLDIDLHLPGTIVLTDANLSVSEWWPSPPGDHVGSLDLEPEPRPLLALPDGSALPAPTPLLSAVEVRAVELPPVVVCFGDSITAAGWPERASALLRPDGAVLVNRGIPGNRLRFDGAGPLGGFFGPAGVSRFDADVLGTSGATHVVIALGTNDLGHPGQHAPESELPTATELVAALDVLAARARAAGLGVFLATITPCRDAVGYDAEREGTRLAVNDWIRSGVAGEVIDMDAVLRSLHEPSRLAPDFDSGDHLHPSVEGLERMAQEARAIIGVAARRP
ncbi:GDSL-type esterase/lipase family protein [Microbacterium lacus]|uniref:SGNH/GDSL hydrolase family protein n=1 Tax=Microbacterium lacus TaxID=415217 RepID=A0ABP4RZL1_9MICO